MLRFRIEKQGRLFKEFTIRDRESLTIGRDPNCDIFLDDPSMSRRHAKLNYIDHQVKLIDLESANGTFVNGAKLSGERILAMADNVKFGEFTLARKPEKSAVAAKRSPAKLDLPGVLTRNRNILYGGAAGVLLLVLILTFGGDDGSGSAPRGVKTSMGNSAGPASSQRTQGTAISDIDGEALTAGRTSGASGTDAGHDPSPLGKPETAPVENVLDSGSNPPSAAKVRAGKSNLSETNKRPESPAVARPTSAAKKTPPVSAKLQSAPRTKSVRTVAKTQPKKPPASKPAPVVSKPSPKPRVVATRPAVSEKAPTVPKRQLPGSAESKKQVASARPVTLTSAQKKSAKELYYKGYQVMAYKSKKRYKLAKQIFLQVQKMAPDPGFEFYQKASEKLIVIEAYLEQM